MNFPLIRPPYLNWPIVMYISLSKVTVTDADLNLFWNVALGQAGVVGIRVMTSIQTTAGEQGYLQ